jgi:hypothetical protein
MNYDEYAILQQRTGRTTRMLYKALEYWRARRAVYVIAMNLREKKRLEQMLIEICGGEYPRGLSLEMPNLMESLDRQTLRLRHAHPNCIVLIDHAAIEAEFAGLIAELHRYDQES